MELKFWEELGDRLGIRSLGKPLTIGLAALLLMVAVFAGKNIIDAATANDLAIVKAQDALSSGDAQQGSADEDSGETLFVYVSGAVRETKLIELPAGSRVADAIEAAGGFSKKAQTESVNLARELEDGEQIFVSEKPSADGDVASEPTQDASADAQEPVKTASSPSASGKVNLNTATSSDLEGLPGIGPATAAKIIDYRSANGSFANIDDLKKVSGIGDKKFDAISDLVCV